MEEEHEEDIIGLSGKRKAHSARADRVSFNTARLEEIMLPSDSQLGLDHEASDQGDDHDVEMGRDVERIISGRVVQRRSTRESLVPDLSTGKEGGARFQQATVRWFVRLFSNFISHGAASTTELNDGPIAYGPQG